MPTTTVSFGSWCRDTCHLQGRGVQTAYEAGASYRLRKQPLDNIYRRADCVAAFDQGWRRMDLFLKSGRTVRCDDCGHVHGGRRGA